MFGDCPQIRVDGRTHGVIAQGVGEAMWEQIFLILRQANR
jgi:hypothetical protein